MEIISGNGFGFQGSDHMNKIVKTRKKLYNSVGNNSGASMVETIVAFTVLVIIFALMYQMISFCSTLRMKAADMETVLKTFNSELYRTGDFPDDGVVKRYPYKSLSASDGPILYFSLDRTATKAENGYAASEGVTKNNTMTRLKMTDINLVCYTYDPNADIVKDGNLTIPKATTFEFEKKQN